MINNRKELEKIVLNEHNIQQCIDLLNTHEIICDDNVCELRLYKAIITSFSSYNKQIYLSFLKLLCYLQFNEHKIEHPCNSDDYQFITYCFIIIFDINQPLEIKPSDNTYYTRLATIYNKKKYMLLLQTLTDNLFYGNVAHIYILLKKHDSIFMQYPKQLIDLLDRLDKKTNIEPLQRVNLELKLLAYIRIPNPTRKQNNIVKDLYIKLLSTQQPTNDRYKIYFMEYTFLRVVRIYKRKQFKKAKMTKRMNKLIDLALDIYELNIQIDVKCRRDIVLFSRLSNVYKILNKKLSDKILRLFEITDSRINEENEHTEKYKMFRRSMIK